MASINLIKASDGTGPAPVSTVQSTRSPLATTLIVDTVENIPATFMGTMGTPHTFVDPVTSEEITVISEATARDFIGAVDGTNLEIDSMAPGFTDDLGNAAGDIVIIKPTTQWSDNVAAVLAVSHEDDGALKGTAVREALNETAGSGAGWSTLGANVTAVAANGNRSYDLTVDTDLRTSVSPGMRLRTTRTVAGNTQCTSLNGTTQYWSCPSATVTADMTFTDDFVAGAWVKLSAYPGAGTNYIVQSRYNGTSGWRLLIDASGIVYLIGYNSGSANYNRVSTYQSLPLNKWVHIAAQLDMSTAGVSTTTSYVMFDGVDVPAAKTSGGTAPTSLIQAGNYEIGSNNGGIDPLNGKIAQAFVSSAKITQANVRTLMSQGLTSSLISTHSIVSAYSFDGVATDLNTTSANDLTANGSATATNADSYSGGQADGTISSTLDYAIVTAVSASTISVIVPSGNTIPTSGGVSSVSYSAVANPYGFIPIGGKWKLSAWDTSGTVTNPIIILMLAYIMSDPLDNIKYSNSGTIAGTLYLSVEGETRKIGLVHGWSSAATSPTVIFPTSFLSTIQTVSQTMYGSAGTTTGSYVVNGTQAITGFTIYSGTNPGGGSALAIGT